MRSPSEYIKGHIPSAFSFPLFSDEERAEVGTLYKQESKEVAFEKGLEFVGPKMADFVRSAKNLAFQNQVRVHCWRGGQRSQSMAWLLRNAGLEVSVLKGGYKAYRAEVHASFSEKRKFIILGGRTGAGKTVLLHKIAKKGNQFIDLEGLANHKGSAFGSLGEAPQPSVEHFENLLSAALNNTDESQPIWLENESRKIGKSVIPEPFWNQMKAAPVIDMQISLEERVQNLIKDYASYPKEELITSFTNIKRRLGGQHLKAAIEALEKDDFATAAKIALVYYDKTYQYGLDNSNVVAKLDLSKNTLCERVKICIETASNLC